MTANIYAQIRERFKVLHTPRFSEEDRSGQRTLIRGFEAENRIGVDLETGRIELQEMPSGYASFARSISRADYLKALADAETVRLGQQDSSQAARRLRAFEQENGVTVGLNGEVRRAVPAPSPQGTMPTTMPENLRRGGLLDQEYSSIREAIGRLQANRAVLQEALRDGSSRSSIAAARSDESAIRGAISGLERRFNVNIDLAPLWRGYSSSGPYSKPDG